MFFSKGKIKSFLQINMSLSSCSNQSIYTKIKNVAMLEYYFGSMFTGKSTKIKSAGLIFHSYKLRKKNVIILVVA